MDIINYPSKEEIREWFMRRRATPQPLPGMEQIRRELGWGLPQTRRDSRNHGTARTHGFKEKAGAGS